MATDDKSYDLLVVGAGPAGGSAALEAARFGLRVAIIEKQKLPRHKTCGGGMPLVVGELLTDFEPGEVVESTVKFMRHTFNFRGGVTAPIDPSGSDRSLALWMVRRELFDNAITERACAAGADLLQGCSVRGLERLDGQVQLGITDRAGAARTVSAPFVVAADGANGVTARLAGITLRRALAVAMEVEHPIAWPASHSELRQDVLHLEYGVVPGGYAWVFPKADHINVGAGVFMVKGSGDAGRPRLKEDLQRAICLYLDSLGVEYVPEEMRYHAHPLPIWNGTQALHSSDHRVLLAGDAAALINPLFGDGILHAIRSGKMAAHAVSTGTTAQYTAAVHAHFAAEFDAARKLSRLLYRFPRVVHKLATSHPNATRTAARLISGDALFTNLASRASRLVLKAARIPRIKPKQSLPN